MNIKPTAMHEVTGTYKENPNRRRKGEPKPRMGIGSYPHDAAMTPSGCWDELVDNICPGVLGNSDRMLLELASTLLSEFRQAPSEMQASRITLLERCLGKMGMTPVDRARITAEQEAEKAKPEDEFFG